VAYFKTYISHGSAAKGLAYNRNAGCCSNTDCSSNAGCCSCLQWTRRSLPET